MRGGIWLKSQVPTAKKSRCKDSFFRLSVDNELCKMSECIL